MRHTHEGFKREMGDAIGTANVSSLYDCQHAATTAMSYSRVPYMVSIVLLFLIQQPNEYTICRSRSFSVITIIIIFSTKYNYYRGCNRIMTTCLPLSFKCCYINLHVDPQFL